MNNDTLFATYAYQDCADVAVRTFNLYVHNGKGQTAYCVRVGPGHYQVFIHTPVEYTWVLQRKAA